MKMLVTASLIFGLGLVNAWSGAAAGGDDPKDKVQTVGKGGLKIGAKITDNDKKFDFTIDLGGKEFQLPMQAKPYSVKLEANKRYVMTLDTDDDDLDPFLVVQDAGGKTVAFDDDSGGKLNSKLTYSPKKDGTFKVYAAALKGTGAFTLKITEASGAGDPKKVFTVGKAGLKIEGALDNNDRKIDYQIKMKAGKTYRIDLKSKDFDAYLFLYDANGKKLAEDDDGGDGFNSRIIHKAAEDGTYRITATSLGMQGRGSFALEVIEDD